MTTSQLIAHLQTLPPDLPVVVRGYEDGYNAVTELKRKVLQSNKDQDKWYVGEFDDAPTGAQTGFEAVELFGVNSKGE